MLYYSKEIGPGGVSRGGFITRRRRGANSLDGGANPIYFIDFLKNPIKEILVRKGGGAGAPLDPPLVRSRCSTP